MSDENVQSNNLLMFKAGLSQSFQDIAKCVSKEEFSKILTFFESEKSVPKKLHKAMEKDLTDALEGELEELVTEECIVKGMQKLSELIEETKVPSDVKVWRPPGKVKLHMRSLDADKMLKECENLEKHNDQMEQENKELMEMIKKKRKNLQSVSDRMKQLLDMPFELLELENTVKVNQECVEKLYKDNSSGLISHFD